MRLAHTTVLPFLACSPGATVSSSAWPMLDAGSQDVDLLSTESVDDGVIVEASDDSVRSCVMPPLELTDPFVLVDLDGFGPAVVSVPVGASQPRPVLVAAHGNFDTPEWQCEIWRGVVGDRAFVLCPRGSVRSDSPSRRDLRYEYPSNRRLEEEIDAAVVALRSVFGGYVDDGVMVYAGFSLGAIMGVSVLSRRADRFPWAVLIEGGHREWSVSSRRAFAAAGGSRVLFACGQWDCAVRAEESSRLLAGVGVDTRVVYAKGGGHTYGGSVAEQIGMAFDWLVRGDGRWEGSNP